MPRDARVDDYIARAQPFAQPILSHARALVHTRFPDTTETMKWSMPFFERNGRPLAMMAAFKAHAGIGIFDGSSMASGAGMGNLGKLRSVADLPPDAVLMAQLEQADALITAGQGGMIKTTRRTAKAEIPMPDDLAAALAADGAAAANFAALPPGARRDYLEWVTSARQPTTRAKRIEATVAQAAEGKRRNWRYEKG